MKKLTLALLVGAVTAFTGCQKDEIPDRSGLRGSIAFSGSLPITKGASSSKVPSCSNGVPTSCLLSVTNFKNETYFYRTGIHEENGQFYSDPQDLPYGNYTINGIDLMHENDTIYSVPHANDLFLSHYWDLTVPLNIVVSGDEYINGRVFCYDYQPPPALEGTIYEGLDPISMQTLYFAVLNQHCINQVTVTIDAYRWPEIHLYDELIYAIAVPQEYEYLEIRGYEEGNPNDVQMIRFTKEDPYNPDGIITSEDVVLLDYDCGPYVDETVYEE